MKDVVGAQIRSCRAGSVWKERVIDPAEMRASEMMVGPAWGVRGCGVISAGEEGVRGVSRMGRPCRA